MYLKLIHELNVIDRLIILSIPYFLERTYLGSERTYLGSERTYLGSERTYLGSERTLSWF